MNKVKNILAATFIYGKKHWFIIFAIITYLFFTVYYVGADQTIFNCGNTLNGLGDSTAGPVWRAANTADTLPVGGYSHVTNYPLGESLSSPVDAVVVGQSIIMWITAKVAGPVCGYNMATAIGFFSAAIVMFAFVYSFTKGRKWIALLAGYAVAFTPFFQIKSAGHPSYGFEALLIGVLWSFISLVQTRKISKAILFAVLTAYCFYFDPYFSLMALTILGPLATTWLVLLWRSRKKRPTDKKPLWKPILIAVALFALLVAPIGYIMKTQSAKIEAVTAGTRENILVEAKQYSNVPSEYLLPFSGSFLLNAFGTLKAQVMSSWYAFSVGNVSEDTVGISLVMIVMVALFFIIASWERLQKRRLNLSSQFVYNPRLLIYGAIAVTVMAILLALPPVHALGVPLPSYLLLKFFSIWRILSREYVVVNIGVVILFAVSLVYFTRALKLSRSIKAVLYVLLFFLIFIQYQTFGPFQGIEGSKFSYNNTPAGYMWLKDQKDVKAVAEYPIEKATESDSLGYYLSMQYIHKKALLNTYLNDSPQDPMRAGIKNLADPQTIPTLHALGIDAIVVHGVDPEDIAKIPYLTVDYVQKQGGAKPGSTAIAKDILVVARISNDAPKPIASMQFIGTPLINSAIQKSAVDWQYEIAPGEVIRLGRLPLDKDHTQVEGKVCFAARMMSDGDAASLTVNGVKVADLTDSFQPIELNVKTDQDLKLMSSNVGLMRLTKLGCDS
jgi:hypothetical protein